MKTLKQNEWNIIIINSLNHKFVTIHKLNKCMLKKLPATNLTTGKIYKHYMNFILKHYNNVTKKYFENIKTVTKMHVLTSTFKSYEYFLKKIL